MPMDRAILHADMDAFFASVEQLDFPFLRNKPVLVGSDGPRGVVAAASYEARVFGCHSALPMAIAKRRCPQAVVTPVRGERYHQISKQVFEIFGEIQLRTLPVPCGGSVGTDLSFFALPESIYLVDQFDGAQSPCASGQFCLHSCVGDVVVASVGKAFLETQNKI